jgi:mRNA-degrading endonuclease toxin of MazEF toxin-antitoxin module
MTERGDVLQLRSRVGFGAGKEGERVVVVQATELNSALPTTLVVPLDQLADPYVGRELLVQVPATEAGTRKDCVAIPTHVRFVPTDRFEPGRVGRLGGTTLSELDEKLRLILDL